MKKYKLPFWRRLGFQMSLAIAFMAGLVVTGTGWLILEREHDTLSREMTMRVLAEAQSLGLACAAPLLRHDPELGLHPLVKAAVVDNVDLVEVVVLDREGIVQGHALLTEIGKPYPLNPGTPLPHVPPAAGRLAWPEGENHIVISQPIRHLDHEIGILVVRASRERIDAAIRESLKTLALSGIAGTGLLLLLVLLMVARHLAPLTKLRVAVAGIGSGDFTTRVNVKRKNELGQLADLLNEMAEGLETAQEARFERERIDHELSLARELQETLLPRELSAPHGWSIAAHYTPALEVSGDYYDVIPLDDGSLALVAADVSGKGVPGLVVMAMMRTILRGISVPGRGPLEVMKRANRALDGAIRRGMFVTVIYGIFDPRRGIFHYCSAGHCPPLILRANGHCEWADSKGKAVGMFPPAIFEQDLTERSLQLGPGETLLLYSDGLPEAMNSEKKLLGDHEILRIAKDGPRDAAKLVQRLRARVDKHRAGASANDDLTLLAISHDEVPSPTDASVRIEEVMSR